MLQTWKSRADSFNDNYMKYEIGQQVTYSGLIAEIVGRYQSTDGRVSYDLVSVTDKELTCSAKEDECTLFTDDMEFDETDGLADAALSNQRILNIVGRVRSHE